MRPPLGRSAPGRTLTTMLTTAPRPPSPVRSCCREPCHWLACGRTAAAPDAASLRKLLNSTSEAANGTRSAASGLLSTPKQTVEPETLDPSAHGTPAAAASAAATTAANLASKTLDQSVPSSAAAKKEASQPEPAGPPDTSAEEALLTSTTQRANDSAEGALLTAATQPANDSAAETKQPAASQDAAAAAKKPPPTSCPVRVVLCQRQAGLPLGRAVPAQLPPISWLRPWCNQYPPSPVPSTIPCTGGRCALPARDD